MTSRFIGIRPLELNVVEGGQVNQDGQGEAEGNREGDRIEVEDLETVENEEPEEIPMNVLRDPGCPTEAEREGHMASHIPKYYFWRRNDINQFR